jgi:hypothetical protein
MARSLLSFASQTIQMNFEFKQKCVLLLASSVLIANSAGAQTQLDPRSEAKVHVGPLYLTPRLAVEEFGIDTNVFNNAEEKQDFTFTLAPHVDVWVPFARRALLTTSVTSDIVYYQTYSSERSVNPEVKVRGEGFLGRVTPFAEASYLLSRQRPNFEIDVRSRRDERSVRAGVDLRLSPKLSLELSGRHGRVEFDADATYNDIYLQETLNRETRIASASVRHVITPFTTLVLRAETGNERFQFSPLRDSDTLLVMPGVEFKPVALISGSGFVGFRRFTPLSSSLESFSGLVASAALSYTFLGSTRFTGIVDRDVTYSYERVQPYYVVDGYGLTVRRQLVGRTDVTAGIQRQKFTYRDLLLPGAVSSDLNRVDVTHVWSGSLGYRIGLSGRVGFGVLYQERDTNSFRFRNYQGLRFATSVDYGF